MVDNSKILIIDDEEVVLDSCIHILKSSNYEIATARNGISGLNKLKKFKPDLVFVDLKMPGISGLEVLETINSFDSTIVTIVITGYATVDTAVEAMKQGAYDYLPKPFTPDEFRLITKRGLEKRDLVLETIALRREKELLRENFAAIVSHELRSPLSAVQQNLFNLIFELSDQITEDQQRRLDRMKTRIADLLELISTWLRVIKSDIESIKENFEPLSVKTVIDKAVESVQPHAIRKNIELVTDFKEPISQVLGEEGTLTETVVNICNNSIKYSHNDSQIILKTSQMDDQVVISIQDTGIGISEEDLPYIFDDFYSGKSSQPVERGSGIGLAISRRIIEAHNGTISVTSEFGKGSNFDIKLPAYDFVLETKDVSSLSEN